MSQNRVSMLWESDVQITINRLTANKHEIVDLDYFYQTVDQIEKMKTPDGKKRLSLIGLKDWEERCKHGEQHEDRSDEHHLNANDYAVEEDVEGRLFQNSKKTIKPRPRSSLH